MKHKIGFTEQMKNKDNIVSAPVVTAPRSTEGVKSVVHVCFSNRNVTLAYFNDKFDLRRGDLVYVSGKYEGICGIVVDVAYNFKIKMSQFQKVVAWADTEVHGKFYLAGSHSVTFDRKALPKTKVITWFKAPDDDENDEYIIGSDEDNVFPLADLKEMKINVEIAERGRAYYFENRVRYISIDGTEGYAIVEGTEIYEVEFAYDAGNISHLICNCYCSFNCKHEYATMLQLREILDLIEKCYSSELEQSGYFSAICTETLFNFTIDGKESGSITL